MLFSYKLENTLFLVYGQVPGTLASAGVMKLSVRAGNEIMVELMRWLHSNVKPIYLAHKKRIRSR